MEEEDMQIYTGEISYEYNERFNRNILAMEEAIQFGTIQMSPEVTGVGTGSFVLKNVEAKVAAARIGFSELVTHENILKCLFYNRANSDLVYERRGESLQDYVLNWSSQQGNTIFIDNKIKGYNEHSYQAPLLHQPSLHPHIRSILRGMYQCVHNLHLQGYSPVDLGLDCMSVLETTTSDCVVKILVPHFTDWTPDSHKADFRRIREIIEQVLPISPDHEGVLQYLFSLVDTWRCQTKDDGKIFTLHPSIIHPSQVVRFLNRCGDWINAKNVSNHVSLFSCMPVCAGWNAKFTNRVEDRWLYDTFLHGRNRYVFTGVEDQVRQSLISCARNIAEHYTDYITSASARDGIVLLTESVVMYIFKNEVLGLFESIASCGKLSTYLED